MNKIKKILATTLAAATICVTNATTAFATGSTGICIGVNYIDSVNSNYGNFRTNASNAKSKYNRNNSLIEANYDNDFFVVNNKNVDFSQEGKAYVLVGKTVITKDTDAGNKRIYLKSGSCLMVKNGASFSMNGTLTVEPGAKLYVTNGKFLCGKSSVLENYGRIIVRKNGTLTVQQNYKSNGGSSINLQGEMFLGNLSVSKIVAKIRKYDDNFDLNDYCISYSGKSKNGPTFYYCIDSITIDYYYRYTGKKLVRKGYTLEKVYDTETKSTLKKAADKYLHDNNITVKFSDDKAYFSIDIGFNYSYKAKDLSYQEAYFKYSPEGDGMSMMIDVTNKDTVDI